MNIEKYRMRKNNMSNRLMGLLLVCFAGTVVAAEKETFIEIADVTYGAIANQLGPIGGANGYTKVVTSGDYIVKDLDGLLGALAEAKAGEIIFISGETVIDLTARIYIEELVLKIPAGVTLVGNRGQYDSKGALLISDALKTPLMIRCLGEAVRISGLRIQGPNPKRYLEHHSRSFAEGGKGREYYYKLPKSNGIRSEYPRLHVDNCEISGFSHSGIYLAAGDGHHIHHNFIHHCQYNGLGYGVCLDVSSALIEYNLFNWNRHSIAGTGRAGCSYVARHNVEQGVSLSHCFDMHGGRDRKDETDIAGTTIEIYNNTFLGPNLPVKIRGVPQDKCEVYHNWFPLRSSAGHAVKASKKTTVNTNLYGPGPKATK